MRKLAPGDRLMGAIDLCIEQGTDYYPILSGVAAALRFDLPDDPSAAILQKQLSELGTTAFLTEVCKLSELDAKRCYDLV